MKYDFTSIYDRLGKDATAVDAVGRKLWGNEPDAPKEGFDFIPMWVADMNFATCPAVVESISKRLEHPLFGYYSTRPEYYESIIRWQSTRHGHQGLKPAYIGFENGVHGCITSVVNVFSRPGDKILLHRPAYVGFSSDVEGQGRVPVYSDLVKDENGIYRMNFEDMDAKLKANNIHLAIFCSPHNPTGRVWERWELEKAMEVFAANDCFVISDEIWADINFKGHKHIPTQMVNDWAKEHTVAAYALAKTFNLAGMSPSYHIIYNKYLRDRVTKYAAQTHYNSQNVLGMYALLGAYSDAGYEWTDELNQVLEENSRYACDYINQHFEGVSVTMAQGTYMLFVDFSDYCQRTGKTMDEILKAGWDVGIGWQDGRGFGGPHHIRLNIALPLSRVQEACERMSKYVL